MNRYFIYYPRNFANEYTVYVCDTPEVEEGLRAIHPEMDRITRKRALYLGSSRPREARQTGQYWSGGFVGGEIISGDAIRDAVIATHEFVREFGPREGDFV